MKWNLLPSYATIVVGAIILANLASAWVITLTMGKNKGEFYDQGPPWMVALSILTLLLCWYDLFLPIEVSFWGATAFAGFGLWGAWADYTHLLDHYRDQKREKSRKPT